MGKLETGHVLLKPGGKWLLAAKIKQSRLEDQWNWEVLGYRRHFHFALQSAIRSFIFKSYGEENQTLPVEATALYNSRESRSHRPGFST